MAEAKVWVLWSLARNEKLRKQSVCCMRALSMAALFMLKWMMVAIQVSIQKFNMIIMKGKILRVTRELCIREVEADLDLQSLLEVGINNSSYITLHPTKTMAMAILRSNSEEDQSIQKIDISSIVNHHLIHLANSSMEEMVVTIIINQTKLH